MSPRCPTAGPASSASFHAAVCVTRASLLFRQGNERWGWDVLCMWMQGRQASALTSQVNFTGQHTSLSSPLTNIDSLTVGRTIVSNGTLQGTPLNVSIQLLQNVPYRILRSSLLSPVIIMREGRIFCPGTIFEKIVNNKCYYEKGLASGMSQSTSAHGQGPKVKRHHKKLLSSSALLWFLNHFFCQHIIQSNHWAKRKRGWKYFSHPAVLKLLACVLIIKMDSQNKL